MSLKKISLIITLIVFLLVARNVNAQELATILFSSSGVVTTGQNIKVDVFINSGTAVNAAQLTITYPQNEFQIIRVDSATSAFTIKAEQTEHPGIIKIARGNIKALRGKNLFASLTFKAILPTSSISHLGYSVADSLVMSNNNTNILSGSQVQTVRPTLTVPSKAPQGQYPKSTNGFISIFTQAVKVFLHGLFK